ncbi:Methyltransferase [Rhodococcus sp. AW25M09]|uniref:class I SAM-dependent methyltransferase n=1 Tax=Rhodococcus sp. AW25M09 TaxID=1268303 RepID=UPI0002ACC87B|nr:class I SAM-dependent methyltransferase [Rhodococcus sp. AW25M09]CCQ17232.1 Methyltransferase [Rhodococcus sp. AW25M09]
MPIDFADPSNGDTYSGREADSSWFAAVTGIVDPVGAHVVDLGCGGGTYSRAWHSLGAQVTAIDSSEPILESARRNSPEGISFEVAPAELTGLPDGRADAVFARALVHHLPDVSGVAAEAFRLLRPGGTVIVQDRTSEDATLAGSSSNPRGFFFDAFPRLAEIEHRRRHHVDDVRAALTRTGFADVATQTLWETRRRYGDREQYLGEITGRIGRSILHELSDSELSELVEYLRGCLDPAELIERDRWTLWTAIAP